MANSGQIFEDRVKVDLEGHRDKKERFYLSVAENIFFKDSSGIQREIDDLAIRHIGGKKYYIVIIECKISLKNKREKATRQLMYARKYLKELYPYVRIFCFFAHSYNFRTRKYVIERIKNSKLDEIENEFYPKTSFKS